MGDLRKEDVLGLGLTTGACDEQVEAIVRLARSRTSSYVCCVNAHMTVEAHRDTAFRAVVNGADLATPDGMPVLFAQRWFHRLRQERVAGNDLMPALLAAAERAGVSVYLYGGEQATLEAIGARIAREHPRLVLAGTYSPPFRALTANEEAEVAQRISASGAGSVLVSLGCPKQEKWMAAMKGRINAAMVGLGGAFLLYAGTDTRAPRWMRDLGLEWSYRLALEPRRLWKRYLVTNTRFLLLLLGAMLRGRGKAAVPAGDRGIPRL